MGKLLSEYTKAERHEIYKKAKKDYVDWIKENREIYESGGLIMVYGGMCDSIHNIIEGKMRGLHPEEDTFEIGDELPEMASIKPEQRYGVYWWPVENTELRIKMFDKIIEMTKPDESQ